MRTTRRKYASSTTPAFNATALIDVIFTLSIFVMLVSNFAAVENMPIDLPEPYASQAREMDVPDRIVINCLPVGPAGEPGALYSLGPNAPEPLDLLEQRLKTARAAQPEMKAVVRADRHLHYADVRALFQVLARQRIEVLHVAARSADRE